MSVSPQGTAGKANAPSQPTELEITRQRVNYQLNSIRLQPIQQLPMNLFLMWMVGNDVSMFSIMFVGSAVVTPLTNIIGVNKTFAPFEEEAQKDNQIKGAVRTAKLIYIASCAAAFFVALVKLTWMNLLPILSMDWMSTTVPSYKESSFGLLFKFSILLNLSKLNQ